MFLVMQRFFLSPKEFAKSEITITDTSLVHQIIRVMRAKPGDTFIALDGSGDEYQCSIKKIDSEKIIAQIVEKKTTTTEPTVFITLYQALPKKMELFEWVLQKGTEIGISRFVPLISSRTERSEISKKERLEKILKEAAEQSERGKIPELNESMSFENAVKNFDGLGIVLHGRNNPPPLSHYINEIKDGGMVSLFVGPEGGFSEKELECAREKIKEASLGTRVLRTETAGIAAASRIVFN